MKKRFVLLLAALFAIAGGAFSQQALPYSYGFEENENSNGWIVNSTDSKSGMFNTEVHGGSYCFGFGYDETAASLISPLFTGGEEGIKVSFWYKGYPNGTETFQVGYTTSETETNVDNFTFGDAITAPTEYQQYTNTFPAGTKRIAIKHIYSGTAYKLFDDFTFEAVGTNNNRIFTTAGNWNDAANWSPASVPTESNTVYINADVVIPAGTVATANTITINGGSITIKDGGELKSTNTVNVTFEKNISGYGDGEGKFYLIASPHGNTTTSADVQGLLEGTYDYYAFQNGQQLEWINYQQTNFNLSPSMGVLYSNKEDKTLKFNAYTYPTNQPVAVGATYSAANPLNMTLVGNIFPCTATIIFQNSAQQHNGTFYKLNAAGDGFVKYAGAVTVAPGEAVLVEYSEDGQIGIFPQNMGNGSDPTTATNLLLPAHGTNSHADAGPVELLTVNVTANDGGDSYYWSTYYNATTNFTTDENTTVYKAALNGTSSLTLTEVANREIPAGKAVILKSSAASITLTPVASTTADLSDNVLKGGTSVTSGYDAYALSRGDGGSGTLGFYKFSGSLDGSKAHLEIPTSASARSFIGFGDNTTGIELPALSEDEAAEWYSLDGQRLSGKPARKGVYVRNGQKYIIK